MIAWAQPTVEAILLPKKTIGSFSGYLTIAEDITDDIEITQHPVQRGASITDHAFKKPVIARLSIALNSLLTPAVEQYNQLLELQAQREPFTLVTSKRSIDNMLITSIQQSTDSSSFGYVAIQVSLQQVILVDVETTTVAPRARQAKPRSTGKVAEVGKKQAKTTTTAAPAPPPLEQNKPTKQTSVIKDLGSWWRN